MKKGGFEKFRSDWLLQIAGDRCAKAAAPVAIVLAFRHLNRVHGTCWPAIETLASAIGADATNTVRSALQTLELRGHLRVRSTKGGRKQTNVFTPLVAGIPFKNLKGFEDVTNADFGAETLQEIDEKPFKKLKGNHLKEPLEGDSPPPGGYPPIYVSKSDVTPVRASGSDAHRSASGLRDDLLIPPASSPDERARILDELTLGTRSRLEAKRRIGDLLDRGQLTPRLAQQIIDRVEDDYEQTA